MASDGSRTVTRDGYRAYIRSGAWADVRKRYWASQLPKVCYCCERADVSLDLHHRTYKNLGNERLMDLVPLGRNCHDAVHVMVDEVGWDKLWWAAKKVRKRLASTQRSR